MRPHRSTPAVLAILLLLAGPGAAVTAQSVAPPAASPMATSGPGSSEEPLDTSAWTTYVSDRYGFSIGHPADWVEVPADHTWTLAADTDWLSRAQERFHASDRSIAAGAWSVAVPPGTTADAWIAAYCPLNDTAPCPPSADRIVPVTIDGHPGSLVRFDGDTQAFILVGDRMYVVSAWQPEAHWSAAPYGGATRLLEGFLSTMHLLPGGPAPSGIATSPSAIPSPAP